MPEPPASPATRPLPPGRLSRLSRGVRRAVLTRRRLLAAVVAALAVATGLQAGATPAAPTVSVPVAVRDLAAGATLSRSDVVTVQFAPGSAPDGLDPSPAGRVLAAPLRRGEPVTDVRLVGPALTRGRPGLSALPVRLPDAAMADLLRAGDRIDLVAADPQGAPAEVVVRDALVLAVPTAPESSGTDGLTGRLVVLGIAETDIARVSSAALGRFLTFAYAG